MPRLPDSFLTSDQFKARVAEADEYASANSLDKWATRIAWIGLVFNALAARRFAQRRSQYQVSRAWHCYTNLIDAGLFSEDPEGIAYTPTEPYEGQPLLWFDTVVRIADGMAAPQGLPSLVPGWDSPPKLRVINGG
jgi:hypothetical protein